MSVPDGGHRQGLRDILKSLRDRKRTQLERFNLSGLFKDIERKLDDILNMESETIDQWLRQNQTPEEDAFPDQVLEQIAQKNRKTLDELPEDAAGKMQQLQDYEFLNPEAQKAYLKLLNELRQAMTQTFFNDIEKMVNKMSPGDMQRMKEMLRALNELMAMKAKGVDPDVLQSHFRNFMSKFGDMFGADPPKTLDELIEQMAQQMAAAQSLMNSLTPDQREQLQSLLADRFNDSELESELQQLAPRHGGVQSPRWPLSLRRQRRDRSRSRHATHGRDALARRTHQSGAGGRAGRRFGAHRQRASSGHARRRSGGFPRRLEDAARRAAEGGLRAADGRQVGAHAARIAHDRAEGARRNLRPLAAPGPRQPRAAGRGALRRTPGTNEGLRVRRSRSTCTCPRTIRNAIDRDGPKTPVSLKHEDFEIYRSELITSTATAMLVDLSWSMALRGSFQAAKKVALALHNLITSRFPKDSFHIIGFAAYAKELKAHDLPFLQWDEYVLGTNMQHALLLADRLLAKHSVGTKQIIMISDGEPTAHLQDGRAYFAYPPTPATYRATFRAVKKCTQSGVAINTFMLDADSHLKAFMDAIARINGGRVFYTSPEKLGEYILVDYVQRKRSRLRGVG